MDPIFHLIEALIKVLGIVDLSLNKLVKKIVPPVIQAIEKNLGPTNEETSQDSSTPPPLGQQNAENKQILSDAENTPQPKKKNIISKLVNGVTLSLSLAYLSLFTAQEVVHAHELMITGALGSIAALPVLNVGLELLLLAQALYEARNIFNQNVSNRSKAVNTYNILVSVLAVTVALVLIAGALSGPQAGVVLGLLFALYAVRTLANMYDKYQKRLEEQKKDEGIVQSATDSKGQLKVSLSNEIKQSMTLQNSTNSVIESDTSKKNEKNIQESVSPLKDEDHSIDSSSVRNSISSGRKSIFDNGLSSNISPQPARPRSKTF